MTDIKLGWAEKIRERMDERNSSGCQWATNVYVREFIAPILEYADSEEKRINEGFKKKDEEIKSGKWLEEQVAK